jgi:hypothetical protein
MHGKTSTASQASAGRDTRHAGPLRRAGHPARLLPPADAQGNAFGDRWPLHSFLELGALPGAVPCARLHAQQMLWEWQLTALSDTTGLLISELVTNAVSVSRADVRTTPVRVWVLSDGICVLIVVWDASPLSPVRVNSGDEDEGGRGLLLVETLSTRWNWYFPPQPEGGKAVWALIKELPPANAVFRSFRRRRDAHLAGQEKACASGANPGMPPSFLEAPAQLALPRCGCADLMAGVPRLAPARHPRSSSLRANWHGKRWQASQDAGADQAEVGESFGLAQAV